MSIPPSAMHHPYNVGESAAIHAVEYRVGGSIDHANCRNIPCALCEATGRGDKLNNDPLTLCVLRWLA